MKRALCLLRADLPYRREVFLTGLRRVGIPVIIDPPVKPNEDDVLIIWNRYGDNHRMATKYEANGGQVICVENGHLGKNWRGGSWLSMTLSHNAGAGRWPNNGPERWDGWNVPLEPFKEGGEEYLITEQRGIGEPGVASPEGWHSALMPIIRMRRQEAQVRVRAHPGTGAKPPPLREDLANIIAVITYHSAAATEALMYGVPVFYDSPNWIGRWSGKMVEAFLAGEEPLRDASARLEMFRNLAWAMWTVEEIQAGDPFKHLLFNDNTNVNTGGGSIP